MKHTEEPWPLDVDELPLNPTSTQVIINEANYLRAQVCVNAMAGIEDPVAYLYQQKADIDMLSKALEGFLESHAPYHASHAKTFGELSLPGAVINARAALASVGKLKK